MPESMTVVAVGDMFPNGRFFRDGDPISPEFAGPRRVIQDADIAFANFLMPLSTRGEPLEKLANIRAHPEIAEDVGKIGFDIVSLANNHSMDYGFEALQDTIGGLERHGIQHLGAGESLAEASRPIVMDVRGWRIGFLAFCCLLPPGSAAMANRPGVAPIHVHSSYEVNPFWQIEEPGEPAMVTIRTRADESDQKYAEDCVRRLASDVDFLCLSLHWGFGATEHLAEYQRPLGKALLDAGADVIFGNHVHAIHGVEAHGGKAILYAPGTFLGRQTPSDEGAAEVEVSDLVRSLIDAMSPDGYLAVLEIQRDRRYSLRFMPTTLGAHGLPSFAEGTDLERIGERIRRLSAKLDTDVQWRDGTLYLDPA